MTETELAWLFIAVNPFTWAFIVLMCWIVMSTFTYRICITALSVIALTYWFIYNITKPVRSLIRYARRNHHK